MAAFAAPRACRAWQRCAGGDAAACRPAAVHRVGRHRTRGGVAARCGPPRCTHPGGRRFRLRRCHRLRGRRARAAHARCEPRDACGTEPDRARLWDDARPGGGTRGAAPGPGGDGGPRHRLPCRHRCGQGARLAGSGDRSSLARPDAAVGRCHRQSQPARRHLCQQGDGRGGGDLLPVAGATGAPWRVGGPGLAAGPGRGRDGGRHGGAGCQQSRPGRRRVAPPARGAGLRWTPSPDRRVRPSRGHAVHRRHRLRDRATHQCSRPAGGHGHRHRMPAQR